MKSKNALAELAEELKKLEEVLKQRGNRHCPKIVRKAQRIISELAKESSPNHSFRGVTELISDCRAIAEGCENDAEENGVAS